MINNIEVKKFFLENGYVIIPHFIDKSNVEKIRYISNQELEKEKQCTLKPTTLLQNADLADVIFSTKFNDIVTKIDSGYLHYVPNYTVRKDLVINWHFDDEFVSPDEGDLPGIIQCNIYLQDNHKDFGGGIDVVPGSHTFSRDKRKELIQSGNYFDFTSVKSKKGDLLLFDYRIIHRSSMPSQPRSSSRMALQWTVARNSSRASEFMDYILRRTKEKLHLSDYTDKRALSYFFDAMNVKYDDSFLNKTCKHIKMHGLFIEQYPQTNKKTIELP